MRSFICFPRNLNQVSQWNTRGEFFTWPKGISKYNHYQSVHQLTNLIASERRVIYRSLASLIRGSYFFLQTSNSSEDFHFQFSSFTGLFLIFSIPLQSMYFPPSLPLSVSLHLSVLIHSFFQSSIYPFSIISFIFLLDLSFIYVSYTLSSVSNTTSTLLNPYEILTEDHVLELVLVLL